MSENKKTINKNTFIIGILVTVLAIVIFNNFNKPSHTGEVNVEAQSSSISESERLQTEALKAKAAAEKTAKEAELKAKQAELAKQSEEVAGQLKELDTDEAPKEESKKEESPKALASESNNKVVLTEAKAEPKYTSLFDRNFPKQGKTGKQIYDLAMANPNASQMVKSFEDNFGFEVSVKAAIVLCHENCSFDTETVGVCNLKYATGGDYRRCVYADINSAGMDAGLKQINTYWQRYRIAKLGGPSCEPGNSRDITDPCTASQVAWLKNINNNVRIAVDIYAESGFSPWVGAKVAGIK